MTGDADVRALLDELDHPLTPQILRLRAALLAGAPELVEGVKWNSPNYRAGGTDRVTLHLRRRDRIQLILHRGVKVRTDPFAFADDTGLLEMVAPDRGVIVLDAETAATREAEVVDLVRRWFDASG